MRWPKKDALAKRHELLRVGIGEQPLAGQPEELECADQRHISGGFANATGAELKIDLVHFRFHK